jgi:hypothetical protein
MMRYDTTFGIRTQEIREQGRREHSHGVGHNWYCLIPLR